MGQKRAAALAIALLAIMANLPCVLTAQESIIDAHVHTYHYDADRHWSGPGLTPDATAEEMNQDKLRRTRAIWDEHNITTAVLSGTLDRIVQWHQADPGRVVSGVLIAPVPNVEEDYLNRIRRMAAEGQLQVLGEIAVAYAGIAPDNPMMDTYYALAEELDLPVALHLGPGFAAVHDEAPLYRVRHNDPMLLEDVLLRHPDMRIYLMHAGWPFLDNLLAIMTTYPQVYAGLANINHFQPEAEFHHYLKRLVDAGFGKRLMYGSDAYAPNEKLRSDPYYYISYEERYARSIEHIRSADFLTDEQKRDIFYNNAARFFRLEE